MPELDIFHKTFDELDEVTKQNIEIIKDTAGQLYDAIENATNAKLGIGEHSHPEQVRRCEAVAKTNLEAAVMWAVKGLTKPSQPVEESN